MANLNFNDIDAVKDFTLDILVENRELKNLMDYEHNQLNDCFKRFQEADKKAKDLEIKVETARINNTLFDIISRLESECEEFNQKTGKKATLSIYLPENRYNLYLDGKNYRKVVWIDSYKELTEENARNSIDRLWEEG